MDFVHVDKVTRLDHEIFDHSVKGASFVTQWNVVLSEFSCAELSEILDGFGTDICPEFHTHTASRDIANADIYAIVSDLIRVVSCSYRGRRRDCRDSERGRATALLRASYETPIPTTK